jgi:hypothetical protein
MLPYVHAARVGSVNHSLSAGLKVLSLRQGFAAVLHVGLAVGDGVRLAVGDGVGLAVGDGVGLAVGDGVGDGVGLAVGDGVGDGVGLAVGDAVGLAVGGALQGVWPCTYSPEPEKVPAGQAMHSPLASGTRSVSGWPEPVNILSK